MSPGNHTKSYTPTSDHLRSQSLRRFIPFLSCFKPATYFLHLLDSCLTKIIKKSEDPPQTPPIYLPSIRASIYCAFLPASREKYYCSYLKTILVHWMPFFITSQAHHSFYLKESFLSLPSEIHLLICGCFFH